MQCQSTGKIALINNAVVLGINNTIESNVWGIEMRRCLVHWLVNYNELFFG